MGRVKELRGFAKGHAVPDRASAAARKFIARLAADDIQADLEKTYQSLRESYGFKRRQLESSHADGNGVIRTPRFVYSISVACDPGDAAVVVWRREISSLRDPLVVRSPEFHDVFGTQFSSLVFEFSEPIDVAELVDRLEEEERPGVKLSCASDASWCEIAVKGFHNAIRVDRTNLIIDGPNSSSAASLLDQFLLFVAGFAKKPKRESLR
jgi:hypothetical protein